MLINNDHLNYNSWYEKLKFIWDYDKNEGWEAAKVDEQILQVFSLFDYFMSSPNSLYYDSITNKTYPIGSKSAFFNTIDEIKEKMPLYRTKRKYEKLFLYSIEKNTQTKKYKVRFAGHLN
jgi:hypothetical protein